MQKEQLSAFMDGEMLDNERITEFAGDAQMQKTWQSYHLIRDTLRGDTTDVIRFDISAGVMSVIENEPVHQTTLLIPEAQPTPQQCQKMPFWHKIRPLAGQVAQIGMAACVSLAVIAGVQYYSQPEATTQTEASPVFNTLPMMGKASPVSLGMPSEASVNDSKQPQIQEQRRRINAMLQDYELQRRLHSERLQFEQAQTQQAAIQAPENQTSGTQLR